MLAGVVSLKINAEKKYLTKNLKKTKTSGLGQIFAKEDSTTNRKTTKQETKQDKRTKQENQKTNEKREQKTGKTRTD